MSEGRGQVDKQMWDHMGKDTHSQKSGKGDAEREHWQAVGALNEARAVSAQSPASLDLLVLCQSSLNCLSLVAHVASLFWDFNQQLLF
eukprot:13056-Heterococcus_DN1.PRE.3